MSDRSKKAAKANARDAKVRKEAAKAKERRAVLGKAPLTGAEALPLHGAWVNAGWQGNGYAIATLARRRGVGGIALVALGVDLWGRGVVRVAARANHPLDSLDKFLREDEDMGLVPVPCEPGLVAAIVATGYGLSVRNVGRAPDQWPVVRAFWNGIPTDRHLGAIPTLREGRPVLRYWTDQLLPDEPLPALVPGFARRFGRTGFDVALADSVTLAPLEPPGPL